MAGAAILISSNLNLHHKHQLSFSNPTIKSPRLVGFHPYHLNLCSPGHKKRKLQPLGFRIANSLDKKPSQSSSTDEEVNNLGVSAALTLLRFYKREISPLLPRSCRYVPTCSEYSMIAYKKYGFTKGTVLTAWRLCRCNPLGGSGFDPPRWFDEESPPEQ